MAIQTVLGKIPPEELGVTSAHEHIFIDLTTFFVPRRLKYGLNPADAPVGIENLGVLSRDPYALRNNLHYDDFDEQLRELEFFREAGGQSIADATIVGLNRDPEKLMRISRESGLNVLVGTGYYVASTHPADILKRPVDDIAEWMVGELERGIDGSGVKAGFIGEIGVSEVMHESEVHVLRAAAAAGISTGAAVHVHINPWTENGLAACGVLLDEGLSPDRICIDHVDVIHHFDYIRSLLDMGVYVEFDNFGKEFFIDIEARRPGYDSFIKDTERAEIILRLHELSYTKQILVANDICLKNMLHAYGGWGYDHLVLNIPPMLREAGLSQAQIDAMYIDNPARFFNNTTLD